MVHRCSFGKPALNVCFQRLPLSISKPTQPTERTFCGAEIGSIVAFLICKRTLPQPAANDHFWPIPVIQQTHRMTSRLDSLIGLCRHSQSGGAKTRLIWMAAEGIPPVHSMAGFVYRGGGFRPSNSLSCQDNPTYVSAISRRCASRLGST